MFYSVGMCLDFYVSGKERRGAEECDPDFLVLPCACVTMGRLSNLLGESYFAL